MTFRPFSEKILNISNILSELFILIIFTLVGISMTKGDNELDEGIDFALVFLVNTIMGVQMLSSIIIFVKNLTMLIKMRRNKVVPISISKSNPNTSSEVPTKS